MNSIHLDTGFNISIDFPLAPFHRRLLAMLLDISVLFGYLIFGHLLIVGVYTDYALWDPVVRIFYVLPPLFYHFVCETLMEGQSFGKKVFGIRVISEKGGSPTISQYLLRWMLRVIDSGFLWMPGLLSVLISEKSQRLGDLAAGTVVISIRQKLGWQETLFEEVESDYVPRYPAVMKLSDKDINTIKNVLNMAEKNKDNRTAASVVSILREKLGIDTDEPAVVLLRTLLKDYNYYTRQ